MDPDLSVIEVLAILIILMYAATSIVNNALDNGTHTSGLLVPDRETQQSTD